MTLKVTDNQYGRLFYRQLGFLYILRCIVRRWKVLHDRWY